MQRVTVELTVEEERRQFEADVLERASEAISEVGDRIIPPPLLLFAHTQYTRRGVWMGACISAHCRFTFPPVLLLCG